MKRLMVLAVAAVTVSCHALPPLFEPADEAAGAASVAPEAVAAASDEAGPPRARDDRVTAPSWWSPWPSFALDDWSRRAEYGAKGKGKGRLVCPDVELVGYRGEGLRYHKALRVNPAFREVLGRFEAVASAVAVEVYGRPPSKVIHYGTYNCRTVRRRGHKLSEHAFGNAIDVAGFEFAAAPRAERKALGRAGRAFRVDVEKHWDRTAGFEGQHARFLKRLVIELRKDRVFRGMIVPPAPGHHNHLHLDMGRWAFVRGDLTLPPPEVAVGVEGPRS
ncbi:MAG: extensin family protein [bacterium]